MLNLDNDIGLPGQGFLGMEFKKKMTMKEADAFAASLRETLGIVSLTTF
jgi:hypothetical protein